MNFEPRHGQSVSTFHIYISFKLYICSQDECLYFSLSVLFPCNVFTPIRGDGVNTRLSALFLGDMCLVYNKAMETPRRKKTC